MRKAPRKSKPANRCAKNLSMNYTMILVRVWVRDIERSVRFYEETLGMALASRGKNAGWAEFDTGACRIALEEVQPDTRLRPAVAADEEEPLLGRFVGASLAVDDVYSTYEDLREKNVEFVSPPERMPWGGVLAHFRDPDGNVLTLVGEPGAA